MSIKKDTIDYVAKLARIELTKQEKELFAKQLTDILSYMDKINTLKTDDVEPMSHAVSVENVFRKDKIRDSLENSKALQNAPDKKDNFFKVPKVIE